MSDEKPPLAAARAKEISRRNDEWGADGFTVNHTLLRQIKDDIAVLLAEIERLRERIDNANQAASETHRNWKSRCYAIMAALGEDYGDEP